jgi:hypothetical protein
MRFPKTLLEFQAQFPDEESCWDYLRRVRWPRGFVCPRCRARYSHFIETRRLEQCAACRYQASVTAGTVLHGTRVSLRVWFLGAFFLGRHKKGISALQFQRDTGLGNYQTQPGGPSNGGRRGRRDLPRRLPPGPRTRAGQDGRGRRRRKTGGGSR